jgi:hypothetical protein
MYGAPVDTYPAPRIPAAELLDRLAALPHVRQLFVLDRLVNHVPVSYLQRVVAEQEDKERSAQARQRALVEDGHDDDQLESHERQDDPSGREHD